MLDPGHVIAMIAIAFPLAIPIVAILTHHQRKMAELMHQNRNSLPEGVERDLRRLAEENERLRNRVESLEAAVAQPTLVREEVRS
jgi:uncharacterized protein YlxW (UPF0749 family)